MECKSISSAFFLLLSLHAFTTKGFESLPGGPRLNIHTQCLRGMNCFTQCNSNCMEDGSTGGSCIGEKDECYCDGEICNDELCTKHCFQDLDYGSCEDSKTCACNKTIFDATNDPDPRKLIFETEPARDCHIVDIWSGPRPNCLTGRECILRCDQACKDTSVYGQASGECTGTEFQCKCSEDECSLPVCQTYCARKVTIGKCVDSQTCQCIESLFKLTGNSVPAPKKFARKFEVKCP